MAKLSLSKAKGSAGGKSKAKAARKKGSRKGGSRRGRANGGVPYSGDRGGSSSPDTSFDFGANNDF